MDEKLYELIMLFTIIILFLVVMILSAKAATATDPSKAADVSSAYTNSKNSAIVSGVSFTALLVYFIYLLLKKFKVL